MKMKKELTMKQMLKIVFVGFSFWLGFVSVCLADNRTSEGAKGPGGAQGIEARFAEKLSLSDMLSHAYASNPAVTASKQSWQVFIENYRIGTSYADPQISTTFYPSPIETRLGPQDWNLTLSQAIPFPGTLSQKGKVLESDVTISRLKLDRTVKEMVRDLSSAYYELVYIQKAISIAQANLRLNQELVRMGDNAYALDRAQLYDISKARAGTAQIQYDILLLKELEQTEKAGINTLMNREPNAPLGRAMALDPREPVYTLEAVYDLAMVHQEDIRIAHEAFEQSKESVKLAKLQNLPSFKLGLFYAGIGKPDVPNQPSNAGDDALGVQMGLNLPLWFGKNRSHTAKALALKEKARADKDLVANKIKDRISRLWFKLDNSRRLITLYEDEMLPQAMAQVRTAQIWVEQGQGSLADFLEIQATAYNFQLSLERARADFGQTLVKLEQLAGVVLDRKIQMKKES